MEAQKKCPILKSSAGRIRSGLCRIVVPPPKLEVVPMSKPFGYERGAINYFIGNLLKNFIPMYIFGSGVRAMVDAILYSLNAEFVDALLGYFMTKYLPPSSLEQAFLNILFGTGFATLKWYLLTPRQG
jgi:hypothetical protein